VRLDVELLEQGLGEAVRLHPLLQVVGHEAQAALPAPVRETLLSVSEDIKKLIKLSTKLVTVLQPVLRIRILMSSSKNSKKNLDFYCTYCYFFLICYLRKMM
jgi:hypothetical protein